MSVAHTVCGPVAPTDLGVTQMHEHLFANFPAVLGGKDPLDDETLVIEELACYRAAGGRSLVDLSVPDVARNPEALRRISKASGLHVVMGCGWYLEPAYPPLVDHTSTRQLAAALIREIEEGVDQTGIRPGIIGEIGSHKEVVSAQEERVFRACARAARATGLAVSTHSIGRAGLEHMAIMREEGLDPARMVIGHSDYRLDYEYHRAIVEAGATVEFDWIGNNRRVSTWEERLCGIIALLFDAGFGDRVLISSDVSRIDDLAILGGKTYGYVLETFVPMLRAEGLDETALEQLLVTNPRRILELAA
jgi:phosphotriesterase-related protein